MKIVVLDGYALNPGDISWAAVEALGELVVYDRTPDERIVERAAGAEIVLVNKTPMTRESIERLHDLKFICVLATGYNIVDTEAAKERGVVVSNIPAYSTPSVAQLAIALLLEICHHAGEHSRSVKAGEWAACQDFSYWNYPLLELHGKTMGIIGAGRIGQTVAGIAQALGMNVLAYNRKPDLSLETEHFKFASLEELYSKSDVVSLHCPLTEETREMINADSIARMKDGVILLNTSRGGLVNEAELTAALKSGKVYAAGIDAVSQEPILPENPLLQAPNCIMTPHIGWAPLEARLRLMEILEGNIKGYQSGAPLNVVNR